MKVWPDTTIRVASTDHAVLEPAAGDGLASARLVPRLGEACDIALTDGALALPDMAAPDVVAVKWRDSAGATAWTSTVEVVSRHYFPLDRLKGYGDGRDDFDRLPDETLWMARQAATEIFEQASGRSFVCRLGKTKDYGRGELLALEHRDIREVVTGGYAQASDSMLSRLRGCGPFPRWVEYSYGAEAIPNEVSRAVLELAAYMLRPSNRPIGATGESTDAGYIHFTVAGRDGATAIPEVNAAIEMFGAGRHMLW